MSYTLQKIKYLLQLLEKDYALQARNIELLKLRRHLYVENLLDQTLFFKNQDFKPYPAWPVHANAPSEGETEEPSSEQLLEGLASSEEWTKISGFLTAQDELLQFEDRSLILIQLRIKAYQSLIQEKFPNSVQML